MHHGYELNYFLSVGDEPPVFQFVEGWKSVSNPWPAFSDFIAAAIRSHLKHWPDLK